MSALAKEVGAERNRRILLRIMRKNKKTAAEIAKLLGRKRRTIYAWRTAQYPCPDYAIRLLKILLP
jgi:Putative ATPase subunit of terminase (gpP-like)